ncbi:hypothetical protein LCGC14_3096000 [marine sediment metagenome]|uniref:Uncharacterized protein n=1 Tax=marine sediment metagenome TaxID=412755 RepID=A0A0F8W9P1_9ZZZZ
MRRVLDEAWFWFREEWWWLGVLVLILATVFQ